MKNYIVLIFLLACNATNAQNLRKYIPFKYENLWGIIDSSLTEVVKPQFKRLSVLEDFTYAEFDGKVIYNLKTGEHFPSFGRFRSKIKIEEDYYYLFTNNEKSILINFQKKDTIRLSLRYKRMRAMDFYNNREEKVNTLLIGYLAEDKILFLKNEKNLGSFLPHRFEEQDIETIVRSRGKKIGLALRRNSTIYFYDCNLKVIKKIKDPKEKRYQLLTKSLESQIPIIYKMNYAKAGYFSRAGIVDDSWSLKKELAKQVSENPNNNDFYITKESWHYFLNSATDSTMRLKIRLHYFHYPGSYRKVEIKEINSLFFYEAKYMKAEKIMFPRKYLIKSDNK